jgi:hypothetical protein
MPLPLGSPPLGKGIDARIWQQKNRVANIL